MIEIGVESAEGIGAVPWREKLLELQQVVETNRVFEERWKRRNPSDGCTNAV